MTRASSGAPLSRRQLLALAGVGATAWMAPQLSAGATSRPRLTLPKLGPMPGQPLARLPELPTFSGAAGLETSCLTAAPLSITSAASGVLAPGPLAYGAGFPGPVIRLREGQPSRVILRNRTGEPTNLHLHGLRIPPHVDQPFLHLDSGSDATYRFHLPPRSAGTYWYHPHLHGSVEDQMERGLVGPMIVEPTRLPAPLAGCDDHLVVLSTRLDARQVLVNGAPTPTLEGTTPLVRLRLLNAGVGRTLTLRMSATAGPGEGRLRPMWVVATDGGFVNHPVRLTSVTLGVGERVEVLVDAMVEPAALLTSDDHVAQLVLTGPSSAPTLPARGAVGHVPLLRPARNAPYRRIVLTQASDGSFRLDGRLFDPHRIDQRVRAGALEVWDIVNTTGVEHPFHLHSWPFQVLRRGHVVEPFPAWRDVAVVQPGQTVRLAIPFTLNKGRTVYHCHVAMHEDAGMMGVIEVA
ncbi:multicopper oxidase domain-containing protein [Acidothermaceae bacterium B102]|nr:multicopper oxidase domain-containing protein [Acidothermaceae bacterium B102]